MNVIGFWIVCTLVTILGMVGIIVAANAIDFGASFFGLLLALFAVLFNYWAVVYYEAEPE